MKEEFDFESIKNKAIEQLKAGKPLLGKDGAFAPLLESILNAALEGGMDAHLTDEERQLGNRRNGKMQKQVQTPLGEVTVSTPRDRNSSFEPQFIKKRETIQSLISRVLSPRAIYNVLGVDKEGHKDLLGMYISKNEGASFWLNVLTDLQNRGVHDILIACVDGLKGFPDAIQSVFPNTTVQLCVVHQIRNSIKYVGSKHQKEFLKDLKRIYGAVSKEAAEAELFNLNEKWGEKYPIVIKSWEDNWEKLTEYFQFTSDIRRMIYTTNTVEGYHRQIRKVTKNKGVFPNDTALEKLVYLAYRNIRKKWTMPLANWGAIAQQLAIKFGDRFKLL